MITSVQNPSLKFVLSLRKSRERNKRKLFLVEGEREIRRALSVGWCLQSLFVCKDQLSSSASDLLAQYGFSIDEEHGAIVKLVNEKCFSKIAMREGVDGLLAVFHQRSLGFEEQSLPTNPMLLILDRIEKPGNVGALLRSAEAVGVDAVIMLGGCDVYNPQCIRNSLGAVFSLNMIQMTDEELLAFCKEKQILTASAILDRDTVSYAKIDYREAIAIILGNEASGVSSFWKQNCDRKIMIPMCGSVVDSLNVSVAGAVMLFEALRQRQNS